MGYATHATVITVAALMTLGAYQSLLVMRSVYSTGLGICPVDSAATWHEIWGPAQLLAIVVSAAMIIRVWQSSAATS